MYLYNKCAHNYKKKKQTNKIYKNYSGEKREQQSLKTFFRSFDIMSFIGISVSWFQIDMFVWSVLSVDLQNNNYVCISTYLCIFFRGRLSYCKSYAWVETCVAKFTRLDAHFNVDFIHDTSCDIGYGFIAFLISDNGVEVQVMLYISMFCISVTTQVFNPMVFVSGQDGITFPYGPDTLPRHPDKIVALYTNTNQYYLLYRQNIVGSHLAVSIILI